MSSLPTTSIEVNEQPRTNRKVVSAVSIGLAVFGCSMLVSNMKSTSAEVVSEVAPSQPISSLTGYIPSASSENLIKTAGSPTKSPSSGVHKVKKSIIIITSVYNNIPSNINPIFIFNMTSIFIHTFFPIPHRQLIPLHTFIPSFV